MGRCSNDLIGIFNFLTLLLSVAILLTGVWFDEKNANECYPMQESTTILGILLLIVSFVGFIAACYRVTWLLRFYLLLMFILIIFFLAFITFTLLVSNRYNGDSLSNRGYKEYRLEKYPKYFINQVSNGKRWDRIRTCIQSKHMCSAYQTKYSVYSFKRFSSKKLLPIESGCCKPSNECNFSYRSPTIWKKAMNNAANYSNSDCDAWNNDPNVLCYNCQSCKAGVLENVMIDMRRENDLLTVFLTLMVIVFCVGLFALRRSQNNTKLLLDASSA